MEVEAPEPAEPVAPPPSEEPEPPKPAEPEAPKPEDPKPKPRKKKATIREEPQEPARAKRQNQRTSTPPALLVDQTFWAGLLATEKARKREARQQTLSNFRIFG